MTEKEHEKKVISIDGCGIPVDTKLVPLIKELNKVGLRTASCCEGHPENGLESYDLAWIAFDNFDLTIEVEVSRNIIVLRWPIHKIGWVEDEFKS